MHEDEDLLASEFLVVMMDLIEQEGLSIKSVFIYENGSMVHS